MSYLSVYPATYMYLLNQQTGLLPQSTIVIYVNQIGL